MTHEQFMELQAGDILSYLWDIKWEIIETKGSSIGPCENNYIKCRSINDQSILEFRRRNGLWQMGTSHNNDWYGLNLEDLHIFRKNTLEQNSIEHFQKKIEETKSELNRLENTLKGLQDSKRMKELTETLSNLIVGDFYTVKDEDAVFTGTFSGFSTSKHLIIFDMVGDRKNYVVSCLVKNIKQIIHRQNFSNEYKILLKKIDTFNSDWRVLK